MVENDQKYEGWNIHLATPTRSRDSSARWSIHAMVGYVENPALCEVLKEVRDQLVDFEIDEAFFIVVLQCLKSPKFPSEAKTGFCKLLVERFEEEIQYLNDQIQ